MSRREGHMKDIMCSRPTFWGEVPAWEESVDESVLKEAVELGCEAVLVNVNQILGKSDHVP